MDILTLEWKESLNLWWIRFTSCGAAFQHQTSFTLETVTRSITQGQEDIHVTRNGDVDWYYPAYQEGYEPDLQFMIRMGASCLLLMSGTPNMAPYSVAMTNLFFLPEPSVQIFYPYNGCVQVEPMMGLLNGVFLFHRVFPNGIPLPLPHLLATQTSSLKLGPVSIIKPDGSVVEEDISWGSSQEIPRANMSAIIVTELEMNWDMTMLSLVIMHKIMKVIC